MAQFFEWMFRLPCKVFTKEEIASEYGERATRPIPPGYSPRAAVRARLNSAGAKPFAVFALDGSGKRRFISSHHSIDAANAKAILLNDENTDHLITYVSGERRGSRGFVKTKENEE